MGRRSQDIRRPCHLVARSSCRKGTGGYACAMFERKWPERNLYHSPSMTAAVKLWTGDFLFQFLPVCQFPVEDLEFLDFVAQVRHMLRRERLVYSHTPPLRIEFWAHRAWSTYGLALRRSPPPWADLRLPSHPILPCCRSGMTHSPGMSK